VSDARGLHESGSTYIYGSHLAMRGVALKVIQELMGHATIETTHLSPEVRESETPEGPIGGT
jgi:site-specific recombinase XerD